MFYQTLSLPAVLCPSLLTVVWPRRLERRRGQRRDALRRHSARTGACDHLPWGGTRGRRGRKVRRISVRTLLLGLRLPLLPLLLVGGRPRPRALRHMRRQPQQAERWPHEAEPSAGPTPWTSL